MGLILRETVGYKSHDGYYRVGLRPGEPATPAPNGGTKLADLSRIFTSTSLRWQPITNLTVDYALHYHRYRTASTPFQLTYVYPNSPTGGRFGPAFDVRPYRQPNRTAVVPVNAVYEPDFPKLHRLGDDGNDRMHILTGAWDIGEVPYFGNVTVIRLNAVVPGATMTPMLQASFDDPQYGEATRNFPVPLGIAPPERMASMIAVMLSPDAAFCCGSLVFVDGGTDALAIDHHAKPAVPLRQVQGVCRTTHRVVDRRPALRLQPSGQRRRRCGRHSGTCRASPTPCRRTGCSTGCCRTARLPTNGLQKRVPPGPLLFGQSGASAARLAHSAT